LNIDHNNLLPCQNKHPHITLCVSPGAKAVESNSISNWESFDEVLEVSGTIQEWK